MGFHKISDIICVHGRFQPFHRGHMDYISNALEVCPNLIIGITAFYPLDSSYQGVEHRTTKLANPLTYFERVKLIKLALIEEGVSLANIDFIPFPIDEPEKLKFILPDSITCATTLLYEWNEEKIRRLEKNGYHTIVLDNCKKLPFDGTEIRKLILMNDNNWRALVHNSVANTLESWSFRERLIHLSNL
jgi:cytidyltransferase-like protein